MWCFLREHGEHLDSTGSSSTGVCHAFHTFPLSPSSLFNILDSNLNWFNFCFQLLFIKWDYHEIASILKSSIRFYLLYLWIFIAAIHCFILFYFILFYFTTGWFYDKCSRVLGKAWPKERGKEKGQSVMIKVCLEWQGVSLFWFEIWPFSPSARSGVGGAGGTKEPLLLPPL